MLKMKFAVSSLLFFFILPFMISIRINCTGNVPIEEPNAYESRIRPYYITEEPQKEISCFIDEEDIPKSGIGHEIPEKLRDSEITVRILDKSTNTVFEMTLHDYIVCATAGEMPATFSDEALMAQAIAARTYTVSHILSSGHADASVCTSSTCCQAFVSVEQMKKNWGSLFEEKYEKIKHAVEATDSLIMEYGNQPIKVFYFSTSNGSTEACNDVFVQNLPYYKSVKSPGEETAPKYYSYKVMKITDFLHTLDTNFGIKADEDSIRNMISYTYTDGGRVDYLKIGQSYVRGTKIRSAFGLRSADFHITFPGDEVLFEVYGNGHGCGMSQLGAQAMAKEGKSFSEILLHYYIGVELVSFSL